MAAGAQMKIFAPSTSTVSQHNDHDEEEEEEEEVRVGGNRKEIIEEDVDALEQQVRAAAGLVIANAICSFARRKAFARLRRAVKAAQQCMAVDILRQFYPAEASILSDPIFAPMIRLRFGGSSFPPRIYFKVFLQKGASSVRYFSGKKMIQPASTAAEDACRQMGKKQFLLQVLEDIDDANHGVMLDERDVVTTKDFAKFTSAVDSTSAEAGGRDNSWRCLSTAGPGVVADLLTYTRTGRPSALLAAAAPQLSETARITITLPTPAVIEQRAYDAARQLGLADSKRRATHSQQRHRIDRMRRMYGMGTSLSGTATPNTTTGLWASGGLTILPGNGLAARGNPGLPNIESNISMMTPTTHYGEEENFSPDSGDEEGAWEDEADELYHWSQDLPVDDFALSQSFD